MKTYLKWTADALALLRLVPTLSIFSHLWKSLLFTLRESGEGIVADWLRSYERPLPPALCRAPADQLIFASFWRGRDGCFPGTGGGSQPAEAVHAAWQTQLQKLGGKGDVSHVLGVMQRLYTESWASWYEWHADSPLHLRTTEIDPNLICGEALKRTPAALFAELSPDTTFYVRTCSSTHEHWVVLVHSEAQLPLPSKMAAQLADIMVATGSRLTTLLKQANVLDGEGKLQLEAAGRMFEDLCCVMGSSLQCSCSVYAYHGQCEHSIFVASLDLTHKPATVDLKTLPQKRKGGRPKAAAEPPRKRRALAKAKAKAVTKTTTGKPRRRGRALLFCCYPSIVKFDCLIRPGNDLRWWPKQRKPEALTKKRPQACLCFAASLARAFTHVVCVSWRCFLSSLRTLFCC